jgi:hypothetical protein
LPGSTEFDVSLLWRSRRRDDSRPRNLPRSPITVGALFGAYLVVLPIADAELNAVYQRPGGRTVQPWGSRTRATTAGR